jgi:hypothetical protein
VVRRIGEFRLPVELEVEFADGTRERSAWSGQERYKVYTWPGRKVRAARLDPDRKLTLEARRLDNHRATSDADRGDGLSGKIGDLGESVGLALLGGLAL